MVSGSVRAAMLGTVVACAQCSRPSPPSAVLGCPTLGTLAGVELRAECERGLGCEVLTLRRTPDHDTDLVFARLRIDAVTAIPISATWEKQVEAVSHSFAWPEAAGAKPGWWNCAPRGGTTVWEGVGPAGRPFQAKYEGEFLYVMAIY